MCIGHVDFSGEVDRAVRILDGVVVVLDGTRGIQTQTRAVWKAADRFSLPRVVFLNKFDIDGCSVECCVSSLEQQFGITPLLLQTVLTKQCSGQVEAVIDLPTRTEIRNEGLYNSKVLVQPMKFDSYQYDYMESCRDNLLENLAILDDTFAEVYLEHEKHTPVQSIHQALRRVTLSGKGCPIFVGSALKNYGVHHLLDGIISYLPCPADRKFTSCSLSYDLQHAVASEQHETARKNITKRSCVSKNNNVQLERDNVLLSGFVFKVVTHVPGITPAKSENESLILENDKVKGKYAWLDNRACFVKVYSGEFRKGVAFWNATKGVREVPTKILRAKAGRYIEVEKIQAGDIGAILGLEHTISGDTLHSIHEPCAFQFFSDCNDVTCEPVCFSALQLGNKKEEFALKHALKLLCLQDPSLSYVSDKRSGQILLYGLGELHLEVARDRLRTDHGVDAVLGKVMIDFKEHLVKGGFLEQTHDVLVNDVERNVTISLAVQSKKLPDMCSTDAATWAKWQVNTVTPKVKINKMLDKPIPPHILESVVEVLQDAMKSGPKTGGALIGTHLFIKKIDYPEKTSDTVLRACAVKTFKKLTKTCKPTVVEPLVRLAINVPYSDLGAVSSDLLRARRGQVHTYTN